MGRTDFGPDLCHPFHIKAKANQPFAADDGVVQDYQTSGQIVGTYIHGIFDHDGFRRQVINQLRGRKGLAALSVQRNVRTEKEKAYDHLADVVRQSLDMDKLAAIMGEGKC